MAARRFLQSLSEDQRKQAQHPFNTRARTDMSYFPGSRSGLALNRMSQRQEKLARELLRSALSENGTLKAETIMTLDKVLREMGAGRHYDEKSYYFAVFGVPGKFPWGWRVEGHHLSVNLTFTESGIAETPSFFGADPAIVRENCHVKYRPLANEEVLARQLIKSLEPRQGHYYRIQGPTFLMEYDNTQDNANHIHTVWRNFDGDYGFDALRHHYSETPHE